MSPWTDSYDLNVIWDELTDTLDVPIIDNSGITIFAPGVYDTGFPKPQPPNPNADTSHVSVYGQLQQDMAEPATLLLLGTGLLLWRRLRSQ